MRAAWCLFILLSASCGPEPVRVPARADREASEAFSGTLQGTDKDSTLAAGIVILENVRAASHPGYDRIVFEFKQALLPGYRLEYLKDPARQCGSGDEVRTSGGGQMLVRFHTAQAHTEDGEPTVAERERRLDLPVLREARLMCDFEGYVDWVLGVSAPRPYRVMELSEPARLIVDVQHGGGDR